MRPLHVTGLGAFTPVGMNVPQSMGSVLSRLQWFDDLDLLGATGEPISGARVRLRAGGDRFDRYAGMAQLALGECHRDLGGAAPSTAPAPLLLATSPPGHLPCTPGELLDRILDQDPVAFDRRASQVFPAGRAGALQALTAARDLLLSGRVPACYVGGVDSMLDPVRLNELLADGRLADRAGIDGFIPGEGAAFLRLEARAPARPVPVILAGAINAPPPARDPAGTPVGAALAGAADQALRAAALEVSALAALVHDGAIEQATAEEIAMAATRLPFRDPSPAALARWAPGFSVGEIGAASAWLALAMGAFFLRERVFDGPVLTWLLSDGAERGAVVLAAGDGRAGQAFKEGPRG